MGHLLRFIVIFYYLLLFPEAYLCCLLFGHLTSLRLNSEWCSVLQKLEYLEKKQDWKTQDPLLVPCCKQETHYQNVHWPSLPAVFQLRNFTGEHEYSKTMHIWCPLITSQPHLMPFAGWSVSPSWCCWKGTSQYRHPANSIATGGTQIPGGKWSHFIHHGGVFTFWLSDYQDS